MIEGTYIAEVIERACITWSTNLGVECCGRARNKDGTYKGDNLCTSSINEAWSSGNKPTKRKRYAKRWPDMSGLSID